MDTFTPEEISYQQGVERIQAALKKAGVDLGNRIITSRDPEIQSLREELIVGNLPEGFERWQLPVTLNKSLLFITVAYPNARVTEHRHLEGPVFRLIISGSIVYEGKELTAGDWMYIPQGESYSFEVGPLGGAFFYPHPEPW